MFEDPAPHQMGSPTPMVRPLDDSQRPSPYHGDSSWLVCEVALKTPIERGSDARFDGVFFSGPPHFGPMWIFFGFFWLNLGPMAPNHSRKAPMK